MKYSWQTTNTKNNERIGAMDETPKYVVLYYVNNEPHECITYFPDLLESAFRSIGVYAEVLSVLLMEQAI
jgi:hypothetical protein